ncbi:TetR family transcriptional regulator C-terminal domain-containing protein [Streptomyces sp. G-5]
MSPMSKGWSPEPKRDEPAGPRGRGRFARHGSATSRPNVTRSPGGCLFTTTAIEFDTRDRPVRDAIARLRHLWCHRVAAERPPRAPAPP